MTNLAYASPFFIVADLKAAVSFYTGKLGFEVRYVLPGDAPFFAIVGRNGHAGMYLFTYRILTSCLKNTGREALGSANPSRTTMTGYADLR